MKISSLRPQETTPPVQDPPARPKRYTLPEPTATDRFDEIEIVWPTPASQAQEFAAILERVTQERIAWTALIPEMSFIDAQLNNPDLANHPKREWAEKRYARLYGAQTDHLNQMFIQIYYLERYWHHFSPDVRAEHGLDRMTGCPCDAETIGNLLPRIRQGPLQEAAPIPDGWFYPDGFLEQLLPDLLEMSNECTF